MNLKQEVGVGGEGSRWGKKHLDETSLFSTLICSSNSDIF